jgi:uncharacterized protein
MIVKRHRMEVAMIPVQTHRPERILKGKDNWWFLGPGGVARLRDHHLTADGMLSPHAEQYLREQGLFSTPAYRTYSLTVLTSTDCNLGCGYCFQNIGQDATGGDRPPRIAHARLTSETIGSVLDFTGRRMAESGLSRLFVLLFGGEPLLNPRGCLELLARAADYGLAEASMTSNLTLLTPRLASQLSDLRLRSIQVTFDGDREDHDRIRVRRSHGGTFDTILRNLSRASQAAPLIRWKLRVNVSHLNYRGIDTLIERLPAVLPTDRCRIYFVRVEDAGVGYANDLLHTDVSESFSRWQRRSLELGFLPGRPHARLPCQTCGYGDARYGAVVSADGTLSSCWETAGKPDWQVGTAASGYLPPEQTSPRWVTCDDSYKYTEDDPDRQSFLDSVDAALLDYLAESGRL